jgi:hypothetical protein
LRLNQIVDVLASNIIPIFANIIPIFALTDAVHQRATVLEMRAPLATFHLGLNLAGVVFTKLPYII